jgi:hypothetical protein
MKVFASLLLVWRCWQEGNFVWHQENRGAATDILSPHFTFIFATVCLRYLNPCGFLCMFSLLVLMVVYVMSECWNSSMFHTCFRLRNKFRRTALITWTLLRGSAEYKWGKFKISSNNIIGCPNMSGHILNIFIEIIRRARKIWVFTTLQRNYHSFNVRYLFYQAHMNVRMRQF